MEREVHEEGGKEKSLPHSCRGESVQLLELVKACYTSKCARARLCIRIIQSRQRTAELYTRNVQQRVKLHCLFRVLSLHRPTSSPVLISNHASIMSRSISS